MHTSARLKVLACVAAALILALAGGTPNALAANEPTNAAAPARDDGADDIDFDEIVRRPTIGNYKGYAEFKMAHYDNARRIWEALDARGFGEAAFNLGNLYEDGLGVARDIDKAMAYYRRGAELGSEKAVFRAGHLYWFGAPGLAADRERARPYLQQSAASGDRDAQKYLGEAGSASGDDRSPLAIAALTRSAEAGDARAQTRLAWNFEAGRGVARDLAKAAEWFQRAANAGDGEAMYALSVMHATGAGRPQDPTQAEAWLRKSAAAGYRQAQDEIRTRQ
jgi:TPR repeat protein